MNSSGLADSMWVVHMLTSYLLGLAGAFALGVAATASGGRMTQRASPAWRPVAGVAIAAVVVAAIWLWARAVWPTALDGVSFVVVLAAACCGAGLAIAACRGRRTLAVVATVLAVACLGGLASLVVGGRAALSESPFDFERELFSTEDERAFAERLRQSRPAPDEPRILRLTSDDLNRLVNGALLKAGGHHKAQVTLMPDECTAQVSLAGPASWARRFVNIEATGSAHVDYGKLQLTLHDLRIGDRRIPWPLDRLVATVIQTVVQCEPRVGNLLGAVAETTVRPDELEVRFDAGKVGQDIISSLVRIVWQRPDIAAETRIYAEYLLDVAERTPPPLDRLTMMTQAAFELARERSAGGDPRLENRAAIVALAMILGHAGVEPLVGKVLTDAGRERASRVVGTARLQGRADWPRHFLVSAALKLLLNTEASDSIGIFKEQIDSQDGGTGFSFSDMLANMAGIRFAQAATTTESAARAVQERLATGVDFAELFPPAADLPEGFSAEALETEYGGTEGAAFRGMVEELERRLDALPAFTADRTTSPLP
jgi:hypothetical protein